MQVWEYNRDLWFTRTALVLRFSLWSQMAVNHNSLDTIHYLLHIAHAGTTLYNLEVDSHTNYKHTNSKITNSLQLLEQVQHVVYVLTWWTGRCPPHPQFSASPAGSGCRWRSQCDQHHHWVIRRMCMSVYVVCIIKQVIPRLGEAIATHAELSPVALYLW